MNLNEMFGVDETEVDLQPKEVRVWQQPSDDDYSPEKIIKQNIDKANQILDIAIDSISRGMVEARLIEVAIKAVESVTTAAMALNNTALGFGKLNIEEDLLEIKRKELELKAQQAVLGTGGVKNQTNIIVASREEVMKALTNVPQIDDGEIIEADIEQLGESDD
jgi:hypothetical protein